MGGNRVHVLGFFLTFWGHLSGTGIQTFLLSLNIRHVGKLRKYRLTGVGENLLNEKEKKKHAQINMSLTPSLSPERATEIKVILCSKWQARRQEMKWGGVFFL